VIVAAVATLGFWTYQLVWSTPESLSAVTIESASNLAAVKEEAQRQAKAAGDAEAKLNAAEAEQQRLKEQLERQAKAASDADSKRKAAETDQQRLRDEVERQTKAAVDLGAKLKTAEAEQQRLKDEVERQRRAASLTDKSAPLPATQPAPTGTARLFKLKTGQEATGDHHSWASATTVDSCERNCVQSSTCDIFTLNSSSGLCFLYSRAGFKGLRKNANYSSGIRTSVCQLTDQSSQMRLACSD